MERDFMGLGSKNAPLKVKEEAGDRSKDSASVRGSGMQWSFSNKVCALPQFLSFKPAQEDRTRKIAHEPSASSGFMTIPTADAFESNQKSFSSMPQSKQGGNHYAVTTYGLQHFDAYPANRSQEVRIFPVSNQPNQTMSVSMSTPIFQSHLATAGQKVVGNTTNPQPLGGVPIVAPPLSVVPASSSIIGTTDLRNASKSSGSPCQLTIFYAGSVCVFDDVSPEKAQAIMLLAGNGSPATQNTTLSMAQVQAPIPRPSTANGFVGNKSHVPSLSPISVTSHVGLQPGGASCGTNELTTLKPKGVFTSSVNQPEPPKVVTSLGSVATTLIPAAVPQARKASLARFLEKRKERVTNTSPYYFSKKSQDCSSSTPGSDSLSFSVASAGSSPLSATN